MNINVAYKDMKQSVFAPTEQQDEGTIFIHKNTTFKEYSRAIERLRINGFFSKSRAHRLIKKARKFYEISYQDYLDMKGK